MGTSSRRRRRHWSLLAATLIVGALVPLAVIGSPSSSIATSTLPAGAQAGRAQTATAAPGLQRRLASSTKPYTPTAAQLAARKTALAGLATHMAPSLGRHTTTADVRATGGPETKPSATRAPTSFVTFKNAVVNSVCSGCGQSGINEPSAANSGKDIVVTSNWNVAYSLNGGNSPPTWSSLNPYSMSPGFCCDQQVVYDASRDIFLLLQLDYAGEGAATNGFSLSTAPGSNPTSWGTYKFAGAIGGGATDTPDFPKLAVANNNVYVTWNDYPPHAAFARSGLARMPLDPLAVCAGFSYNFITRNTEFTLPALAQTQNSLDQMYWVSNWFLDGTSNGSNLRIFNWAENSGTYFWNTRGINPYRFGNVACGGSPDWCSRLDPRYESVSIFRAEYRALASSAFSGDTILEVATSAGPSRFSNGKNYVVYNYFKLNSLSYIGNDQTYSTSTNFAYPGCNTNSLGYVGCAMEWGTTAPGGLILMKDITNPTQPWANNFIVSGINTSSGSGDYVVTNPWNPGVGPFETVLWHILSNFAVEEHYIVFGRQAWGPALNRWKGK